MAESGACLDPPRESRAAADSYFGTSLAVAGRYAASLATDAVRRGLIGPGEVDRVWDRHILNCAAIAPVLPTNADVIDVGSGAGLPGVVLAIARADLTVTLIEPLARRTAYLTEIVASLGLGDRVLVVRGRAEDVAASRSVFHVKPADIVASRALAPLDRVAGWCLPLARVGGVVMAIKGSTASEEITRHRAAVTRLGGTAPILSRYGDGVLPTPTTVVEIVRERASPARSPRASARRAGPRRP